MLYCKIIEEDKCTHKYKVLVMFSNESILTRYYDKKYNAKICIEFRYIRDKLWRPDIYEYAKKRNFILVANTKDTCNL